MPVSSSETSFPPLTADAVLEIGTLTIGSHRDDHAHALSLFGELDVATAPDVEAELLRLERAAPAVTIVLDLRGLTFIDSTGLRLLIEASSRAQAAPHRLRLLRPAPHVFRVFEIASVDKLLPFQSAPAEADG